MYYSTINCVSEPHLKTTDSCSTLAWTCSFFSLSQCTANKCEKFLWGGLWTYAHYLHICTLWVSCNPLLDNQCRILSTEFDTRYGQQVRVLCSEGSNNRSLKIRYQILLEPLRAASHDGDLTKCKLCWQNSQLLVTVNCTRFQTELNFGLVVKTL